MWFYEYYIIHHITRVRGCTTLRPQEGSMSNNGNAQSDLIIDDRMENSLVDTATVCSTLLVPQHCNCVGCTEYINYRIGSSSVKVIWSHTILVKKGSQVLESNTEWPYKQHGPWITLSLGAKFLQATCLNITISPEKFFFCSWRVWELE